MDQPSPASLREPALDGQTLLDSLPECYWGTAADGRLTHLNRAAEAYFGISRQQAVGRRQAEVMASFLAAGLLDAQRQALETRAPVTITLNSPVRLNQVVSATVAPLPAGGVLTHLRDITSDHVLAELTLALRSEGNPVAVLGTACRLLGLRLGLDRVGYGEVSPDQRSVIVRRDWTREGMPSVVGVYEMEAFGPAIIDELRQGRTVAVEDVRLDPRTASPDSIAAFAAVHTRSVLATPLHKHGAMKAMLFIHSQQPYAWSREHLQIAEGVIEHTWAAYERARAEDELRIKEERLRLAGRAAGVGIYAWDVVGNVIEWSPEMFELTGVDPATPPDQLYGAWLQRLHPDDRERADQETQTFLDSSGDLQIEFRVRRGDDWRWILGRGEVLRGPRGEPEWMLGVNLDITDQKRAVEALRAANQRLTLAHQAAHLATWEWDFTTNEIIWTDIAAARRLVGERLPERNPLPFDLWFELIEPADREGHLAEAEAAVSAGEGSVEYRILDLDGSHRWLKASGAVVERTTDGQPSKMVGVTVDVTSFRRGELALHKEIEQRQQAEQHQRLLINELNHRVKNTLATVQSVVVQTLKTYSDPQRARRALTDRLVSLGRAHDVLTRGNWAGASLSSVVESVLKPYLDSHPGRIRMEGTDLHLGPSAALSLSMALHELATNASKYGALSGDTGFVTIAWAPAENASFELSWREADGPLVVTPSANGFGTRLITEGLPRELGGEIDLQFPATGVVCRIRAPLRAEAMLNLEATPQTAS